MFAIPFGRMLWKEYRVNRGLWLSCLFIGFLFQVIQSTMMFDPQARVQLLLGGASFFSVMYAVGCGALLFACEREERTSDWLSAISIPPAPTLSAKFTFAIVSTVAMQFALALTSLIFLVGAPVRDLWELLLPIGVLVIVWSSLGSLFSRRVLTSVPAMAFWCILSNAMLLYVLGNLRGQRTNWDLQFWYYATILTVFVFALDVWLGWRWCRGHYCDGALLANFNIQTGFSWEKFTRRKVARSRVLCRTEQDQPWRRTWQRLVWQERHRESLHLYLLTIGCIAGVAFGLSIWLVQGPSLPLGVSTFIVSALICLAPLVIGLFAFRADAQLQQPRFLAYRGISPAAVWLAKHVVWLPRAFWIPGVVLFLVFFSATCLDPMGRPILTMQDGFASMSNAVWFVLLSYACGQLVAIVFQRTVIAIAFGGLLTIVMALWLATVNVLALPHWWSLGLPVVAMLSITLWQMRPWLLEDHSWPRRWRLASVLIAAPVMLVMILAFHRVWEVTTFHFAGLVNSGQYDLDNLLASQSARTLSADEESVRNRLQVLSQGDNTDHRQVAEEIVELMKRDLVSLNRPNEENDVGYPYKLFNLMFQAANEATEANELQRAFDCFLANLKLARITSSHGSIVQWMRGSTDQKSTVEAAVIWANHSSQTPASIRKAIKAIEVELNRFPSATGGIAELYRHDRKKWILSSRTELIEELTEYHIISSMESQWPLVATVLLPWERERLDRLTTFNAELNVGAIGSLEMMLALPKGFAKGNVMRETTAQETWAASVGKTTFLDSQITVPLRSMMWTVLDRHTMVRAGLTRMELIAHRLECGKLPGRLVELLPTIGGANLVDPWSGRMFDYYPAFLLSPGTREIELLPSSSTEFEFKWSRFGGNVARKSTLTTQQLTSDSADTNARVEELRKDAELVNSLFVIPPRPEAEPQAQ